MSAQPTVTAAPTTTGTSGRAPLTVPDWGNQVSLVQPRQAAFWLWLACVLIGGLLLLGDEVTYLNYSPVTFVVALVLLAIFTIPLFLVITVLDLFEREPLSLMLGAFAWGALVVLPFALPINNSWVEIIFKIFGTSTSLPWVLATVPPIVEEGLKFAGIVVIFLIARAEWDDVLDGFIYGALVGLGFQLSEDMFYFFTRFVGPAGGANELGALIEGYWIRIISAGLYSHPLYAGISGMGLAYWATRLDQPKARRQQVLIGAFVLAVLLHAFWNAPILQDVFLGDNPGPLNFLLFAAVKGIPLLIFVLLVVRLATRREQAYFQLVMANETGEVATPEELRDLSDLRNRFFARRAMRSRKGPAAARLLSRLQREQIRYAMLATRTMDSRDAALAAQRDLIRGIRSELAAIPERPKPVVMVPVQQQPQPQPQTPSTSSTPAAGTAATAQTSTYAAPVAPPMAPPAAPVWQPTHRVPPTGQQSWDQPDPSRPVTVLAANLDLQVVQQIGDWARVVAINGWVGWVDARLLIPIAR